MPSGFQAFGSAEGYVGTSPPPPQTVTSISPNFGPAAGGTSVTIVGSHFTGQTGATIGGVAVTSFLVVNDSTITCVTPAGTSGSLNDVVVGTGTLASGWLAFSPADLTLSGWWSASYTGAPWTARASAGTSGSNGDLVHHAGDPTVGTAQNGYTPAHNGVDLTNATDAAVFFTKPAGSMLAIIRPAVAVAPSGNGYDDPCIYHDGNADLAFTFTTSGFGAVAYDGAYRTKYVACATGAYHLVMMRWNSTTLGVTLDSASEQTTPCAALTIMTGAAAFIQSYANAHGSLQSDILDIIFVASALSDPNYAKLKTYANHKYGLSL